MTRDVSPNFKQPRAVKKPRKPLKARRGSSAASLKRAVCEANTPGCPPFPHRGVHAHHVQRRSQGGRNDASNLLWVCLAAHDWIHAHPAASFERGWLRHSWETA